MKSLLRSALFAMTGVAGAWLIPACFSTGSIVDQPPCASDADCDDDNPCTADACDKGKGECSHQSTNVGKPCGSGDMTCNGSGQCSPCTTAEDCGASAACATFACVDHACKVTPTAAGTTLADDTTGDCKLPQCDGKGGITHVPAASDVPASADECKQYACNEEGPVATYAATGAPCDDGVCDGAGACVACIQDTDCGGGNKYCYEHTCLSCADGMENGDETGVDCGGSHCLKCNGESCSAPAECKSASCVGSGKCGWPAGVPCTSNGDCASLTCDNGACTAP